MMKKLALNLDDLAVESFDTSPLGQRRGTILGFSPALDPSNDPCTQPTLYESCQEAATCELCWSDGPGSCGSHTDPDYCGTPT